MWSGLNFRVIFSRGLAEWAEARRQEEESHSRESGQEPGSALEQTHLGWRAGASPELAGRWDRLIQVLGGWVRQDEASRNHSGCRFGDRVARVWGRQHHVMWFVEGAEKVL